MPSEASVIAGTMQPISHTRLVGDLRALGVADGTCLIVHASLSSLGWVIGGAQTVVESLLDAVGDEGTVVMPTQSGQLSEPSHWSDPPVPPEWFDTIRAHMPAYDPHLTPTRGIGTVAECFMRHPRSVRSAHPLWSFTANGALAGAIVQKHPLAPAFGDTSPLGRLYELDASVALIGVDHDRNTSLHLAEYRASWPGKRAVEIGAAIVKGGERQWITYEDLLWSADDFAEIGAAFADTGREASGHVAQAHCRLVNQRDIVDFATDWVSTYRS
jgi:aminoglycoside 3-N-acetyltransferase